MADRDPDPERDPQPGPGPAGPRAPDPAGQPAAALSVFVVTLNEAARLGRTLAAVAWADEIVVVDSGSTDGTQEIARAHGARVVHREWEGYGQQKAHAEALCRNDWVLNLDADEVATPGLSAEIRALMATRPEPGAWRVRILNVYPGDERPRPFAADYEVVRLYHRRAGRYRAHPLFDRVVTAPGVRVGRLRSPVHHHPFTDWAHLVEKENRYTSFQARAARPRRRAVLLARLAVEFPVTFLKVWLLRGHVLGGWKGLAFAQTIAFARLLRVIKMLEAAGREGPAGK